MVAVVGIGLPWRIVRRGAGRSARNRWSLLSVGVCGTRWTRSSCCGGRLARSHAGWFAHILMMRRCGCHTKRSTNCQRRLNSARFAPV